MTTNISNINYVFDIHILPYTCIGHSSKSNFSHIFRKQMRYNIAISLGILTKYLKDFRSLKNVYTKYVNVTFINVHP